MVIVLYLRETSIASNSKNTWQGFHVAVSDIDFKHKWLSDSHGDSFSQIHSFVKLVLTNYGYIMLMLKETSEKSKQSAFFCVISVIRQILKYLTLEMSNIWKHIYKDICMQGSRMKFLLSIGGWMG